VSGIAAIYTRSSRCADPDVMARMLGAMADRGGDRCAGWSGVTVTLGVESRHTTPESLREPQPWVDPRTGVVIALDGRLDNRDDLCASLGATLDVEAGDAAYIAAAYERWGAEIGRHLIGDFALIVWDPRTRHLMCARDVMGVRPLYYGVAPDGVVFVASEPAAILGTQAIGDDINEARALEHLVDRGQHASETLYRHILRVPPAHVLTVAPGGLTLRQYWDFTPGRQLEYRDDREYATHARDLLTRVVRAQSRSIGHLGVLLSGGIDSSAIAAIASDAGIACEAVTTTFPGQPCDEAPQASAMASACGFRWHDVPYRARPLAWYASQASRYLDLPDYPNGAMLEDARAVARAAGVRVLLTGSGGDEWFTGSPYRYADWLTDGSIARAVSTLAADAGVRGWQYSARDALLCGIWPALPDWARRSAKRVLGRRDALPAWIAPDAGRRTDLLARVSVRVTPRAGETFAQADMRTMAMGGFRIHSHELEDRAAARGGVEQRHPMYDRRVIEFAFALPERQRCRGTMRKYVLRAAAGERLAPVRQRADKAEFSDTLVDALVGAGHELPFLCSRGWIDPRAVRDLQHDAHRWRQAADDRFWHAVGPLWMFRAMEMWLAAASRRMYERPASIGTRIEWVGSWEPGSAAKAV
jgi:asparagine synthase (glutamine-hydrolysing)